MKSGFKNIKVPFSGTYSWKTINNKDINMNDTIFSDYDSDVLLPLVTKQSCLLDYFRNNDNGYVGEKHYMGLECYHIEYKDGFYQRYMYFPKEDIDNFIREQKIKNILNEN